MSHRRALLDTHVWLWYLVGDPRLSSAQREWIEDVRTELWLSPISVWEAHLLVERGRIAVADSPGHWVRRALQELPVIEAPLTFSIALRSRSISLDHSDPADRFIAATALEMKLTLLTSDERLLRNPSLHTVC